MQINNLNMLHMLILCTKLNFGKKMPKCPVRNGKFQNNLAQNKDMAKQKITFFLNVLRILQDKF